MGQTNVIAAALFILGLTACATTPYPTTINPPTQWGPQFATPGVQLTFEEQGSTTVEGRPAVIYALRATGLPKNKTYVLWQRWLDGKNALLDRFQADDSGDLVSERGLRLGKETFHFYKMFKGEPVDFALVSTDQSVKAFARIVPFPLEARGDGGCSLSMELLSPKGRLFGFIGNGFEPNEEVTTLSKSDNEVLENKQRVSGEGNFWTIIDPGVIGKTGGLASFQASGEACKVILNYEWGTATKML